MKMKRVNNTQEALILTGMVVSDRFLRDVQAVLDVQQFKSTHSKKIAKWCLAYYDEHEKAPGAHIQDIFNQHSEAGRIDDDEIQMIGRTLERISAEFERADKFNTGYILKSAEAFFSRASIRELCEEVLEMSEVDPLGAVTALETRTIKKLPTSEGIDPFNSPEAITRAFEEATEPIMKLPGALGRMMNPDLCRGSFVAMLGQEKIGKTWTLMEFAFAAIKDRANVVFFQAGDMNEDQQIRRMQIRLAGRSNKEKYCGEVMVPTYDCVHNQDDSCNMKGRASDIGIGIDPGELLERVATKDSKRDFFDEKDDEGYVPCSFCRRKKARDYKGAIWWRIEVKKPLTVADALRYSKKFAKGTMRGRSFRLVTYPSDTLSVSMIRAHLDNFANNEGFVADVVVADYPDIMVADSNQIEFRHQQNSIWKGFRALTIQYNCLVVAVTQADAEAYGKESLATSNFSEDKRKYAHVTSFYSLNQTPAEKVAGILRVGSLMMRDEDFDSRAQVKVMQCLAMGRPHVGSFT